jgi:hypothetical protein
MILTGLEVCYIIIHNDVRVIRLLHVKVTVVQCALMSIYTNRHVNLYSDVCEMEATIALTFLHSAYLM